MNKRSACKINGFKYPASDNISGRTSTVCRSMACTLLNRDACSPEEEKKWMEFFSDKCAYCGKKATHLDHLHALIDNRKPTGYGTDPGNLVPCCTDCNQPKGNMHWKDFMLSDSCNHIGDEETDDVQEAMNKRIEKIESFQKAMPPQKVKIDDEILAKWNTILQEFDEMLKMAQESLQEIKEQLYKTEN